MISEGVRTLRSFVNVYKNPKLADMTRDELLEAMENHANWMEREGL